ncbi:MAG: fumarylacetoacetate hydrolase family protein [Firmicutes bacterium]|nr:fumarylacetoacetate hydrolase family protein [Bacillota bacterium]
MARILEDAWQNRRPVDPFHESHGLQDVETAYRIQQAWMAMRLGQGETVVGRKIGLTSRAMQQQLGVNEPDFGTLLKGWELPVESGVAVASMRRFIQPRVEGEIAFLLGEDLEGPGVTVVDVFRATVAVAAAVEVIDSRIRDWRIRLVDTVADNASCGGFAVGPWNSGWRDLDLSRLGMGLYVEGNLSSTGSGAAALGHPAACVAWLANKLFAMGDRLRAGDVVLSGSLGPAVPVGEGSWVRLEVAGLEPVDVYFGA